MPERGTDVMVEHHGTLVLLRPMTPEGRKWVRDHIDPDAMFFGLSIVVEPRYVEEIVTGMLDDGLNVGV